MEVKLFTWHIIIHLWLCLLVGFCLSLQIRHPVYRVPRQQPQKGPAHNSLPIAHMLVAYPTEQQHLSGEKKDKSRKATFQTTL